MTFEERNLLTVDEVRGFEYECLKCHSKVVIPLTDEGELPTACPHCADPWIGKDQRDATMIHSAFFVALREFRKALKTIAAQSDKINCIFRLEVNVPEEKD